MGVVAAAAAAAGSVVAAAWRPPSLERLKHHWRCPRRVRRLAETVHVRIGEGEGEGGEQGGGVGKEASEEGAPPMARREEGGAREEQGRSSAWAVAPQVKGMAEAEEDGLGGRGTRRKKV